MKRTPVFQTTVMLLVSLLVPMFMGAAERQDRAPGGQKAAPQKADQFVKVDINTADQATLETLPGIGPQTAKEIIAARPFVSPSDLGRVPGIGPAKIKDLQGKITASAISASSQKTKPVSGKIDVNTADLKSLLAIPGIGEQTAHAIVAARPFKTVSELENVPGIGPAKMKELLAHVTLSNAKPITQKNGSRTVQGSPSSGNQRSGERPSSITEHRVNLNTASKEELEALPEIGPVKADAIIAARPFKTIEDVMQVKGIKEGTFAVIKEMITVR